MSVPATRVSLYKRSNGVYYIGYYHDGRRRWKSTGATTRSDALKALTEFKTLVQPSHRALSFAQFQDEFLKYAEIHNAKRTVDLFRNVLKGFGKIVRHSMISDITAVHIDRYKTFRLQKVKPVSVNVELRMLKSAFAQRSGGRWLMKTPVRASLLLTSPNRCRSS